MRVSRTLLVKGENVIQILVKVVREHVMYVVCEPRLGLKNGKKKFDIQKGAVLVRNVRSDADGCEYYMVFNGGIYDALSSQGLHAPDGMYRDCLKVVAFQSSIDWAIRQSWVLGSRSSTEDLNEYARRVASVAKGLARSSDEHKVEAQAEALLGSDPHDRLGRVNMPAREGYLWSAKRELDERIRTDRHIQPCMSARYWALIELADSAWVLKGNLENAVLEQMAYLDSELTVATRTAIARAGRLLAVAATLRSVSLAPYSRRGFPRNADDLDEAAKALREGRYADARESLDKCRRAFKMMDARRKLEEMRSTASRVWKARAVLRKADIANLDADINVVIAMLHEDGKPLDRGFKNPVIVPKVLPQLEAARAAARSAEGYQAKKVYKALKAAPIPL